jgi:hypothetical protein
MGVLLESFIAAWTCTISAHSNTPGTLLATSALDRLLGENQAVCVGIRKHISNHATSLYESNIDLAMHGIVHSAHASRWCIACAQAHALSISTSLAFVARQSRVPDLTRLQRCQVVPY